MLFCDGRLARELVAQIRGVNHRRVASDRAGNFFRLLDEDQFGSR